MTAKSFSQAESVPGPPIPSDLDQVRASVKAALSASSYRTIAALDCEVHEGVIVISGTVPSYYLKQLAQQIVLQVRCMRRIHNRIEVRSLRSVDQVSDR